MSTQQRIAHLSGLNTDVALAAPYRGSYYQVQGGGAPGILGGIASGYTVAVVIKNGSVDLSLPPLTSGRDPLREVSMPDVEFICGAINAADSTEGWSFVIDEGNEIQSPDASFLYQINTQGDALVVFTRIANGSLYVPTDPAAPANAAGINNYLVTGSVAGADPFVPGNDFYIGGAPDLSDFGNPTNGEVGGLVNSSISGVWITPGIPDFDQITEFMLASTQAGEIVPAAWPVARTASNLNPETPAAPTGHYFNARDVNLDEGIGGTWKDRIGDIVLERVGVVSGNERVFARDPFFSNVINAV